MLESHPKIEQRQTAAATEGAMPSTKHQRQVLRGQQPGEQGGQQAGGTAEPGPGVCARQP